VNSPTVWVRPRRVDPTPYASLEAVADAIRAHLPCGFEPCETCTSFVPGEGAEDAEVMLVGEAPGASEDRQGRPFVGRAGALLDIALETAGLSRDAVFITNVLKARPPGNRDPRRAEIEHALPWLEAQMALVRPKLVVPLGRHALGHFAPDTRISAAHGQLRIERGRALYPLYHPAAALRTPNVRDMLMHDARGLRGALRGLPPVAGGLPRS
jgi:uracil-DNA glycosylase